MAVTSVIPVSAPHTDIHQSKWNWTALTTSQVGVALGDSRIHVEHANYADRSVQVSGTFGAGGTLVLEGSNDGGANYFTLNDAFGNALSFTSGALKQITESVERVRPNVTGGDGTTSLNVNLFMRKIFE